MDRRAGARRARRPEVDETPVEDRPWVVIVWNDPINLMSYVTFVLQKLFGYDLEKATALMLDVHQKGKAVVASGHPRAVRAARVPPPRARALGDARARRVEPMAGNPRSSPGPGRASSCTSADERDGRRPAARRAARDADRARRRRARSPGCSRSSTPTTRAGGGVPAADARRADHQPLAGIDTVVGVLERPGRKVPLDDAEMLAFVQAVNSVRLVLGTILEVTEDDDADPPHELVESPSTSCTATCRSSSTPPSGRCRDRPAIWRGLAPAPVGPRAADSADRASVEAADGRC